MEKALAAAPFAVLPYLCGMGDITTTTETSACRQSRWSLEPTIMYTLLADLTVVLHVMFVLFVICGGLVVLRWPRLAWLHLPAAIWGGVVELTGWVCPLTHLENHFRRLGGETDYAGSFIEHYLEPILYPSGLTVRSQVIMGVGVLAVNAALYVRLWWKGSHKRG